MKETTIKAILGSIEKWDNIIEGKGVDKGRDNCPLCHEFPDCKGCPVYNIMDKTPDCMNTPWEVWYNHHKLVHFSEEKKRESNHILCEDCKKIAITEDAFLRMLLPKDNKYNLKKLEGNPDNIRDMYRYMFELMIQGKYGGIEGKKVGKLMKTLFLKNEEEK